ncbi:helix-turn-helix domain-containing protein [Lachnoclostridium phytofermentans]|uniref:Helix-turn-helix domain protein n=1 Tax=Lachnoclostridium phytofermentans (strain ATCC 700394 / DSM 18823 / ISDg) TaxID=357809 RepID=A9KPE5_LACP7|nr:helix-turn-helix transcriptional regulator [Lachnoclostridium phytofermentans]ABX43219.1 helix-turn-helix domain protein [Lachnoclostridium phytofermentans ISDg]
MITTTFGALLKEIRKTNNMTQVETCKDICSLRQYVRIENNTSEPSMYLVQLLSHRLNYDLIAYYKLIYCDQTLQANTIKTEADVLIKGGQYDDLEKLINRFENYPEFKKGENLQFIYYYKSLCAHSKKDYNQAVQYCINGLHIEDPSFSKNRLYGKISSSIGLNLYHNLGCYLNELGKLDLSIDIWNKILIDIEKKVALNFSYYQSSIEFVKQLYLSTSYNMGTQKTILKEYRMALSYFDKGIVFANKHNCSYYLTNIVRQKMRVLYTLNRYEEARASYDICMGLYLLQGDTKELRSCEQIMKEDYPELLKIKMYD